jgi:hypothetical protein
VRQRCDEHFDADEVVLEATGHLVRAVVQIRVNHARLDQYRDADLKIGAKISVLSQ